MVQLSIKVGPSYPEFDPIIQNFTVEVGDEIRFNGAESYARMVEDVIYPQDASDGLLKIKLNASMSWQQTLNISYLEDMLMMLHM
jgi:hypothetical protein